MLNTVRNAVLMAAASYAGEKLWDASKAGFRAFQAARSDRAPRFSPVNLNGADEADIATLVPFRVTVAALGSDGAVGACTHDIYAVDANDATAWAERRYSDLGNLRIIVEAVH
jgi:hypothetical protein